MHNSPTPSDPTRHAYRNSYYVRYLISTGFLAAFGLAFVLLAVVIPFVKTATPLNWKMIAIAGFVSLLSLVLAILGPYSESQTRLVTSPQGIEYLGFGFRVFACWEEIVGLEVISQGQYAVEPSRAEAVRAVYEKTPIFAKIDGLFPENRMECLVLRRPVPFEKRPWAKRLIRNQTRYIPLKEFPWWRTGALGKDLKRSAPQIFED